MPTETDAFTFWNAGWTVRAQAGAEGASARLLLLLHGWTGDETVMWVFTGRLPAYRLILAPRGPVAAPGGGFGWQPHEDLPGEGDPSDWKSTSQQVISALPGWLEAAGADPALADAPFDLMGFSQGAAMSYALTGYHPQRVRRMAALAGFLPGELRRADRLDSFRAKPIYIAHGTQDETIPVQHAQETVRLLQANGAQVTYCESEVGHKLSAACLRGVQQFFQR